MQIRILSLDTSSSMCFVALLHQTNYETPRIDMLSESTVQQHAEHILPMVDTLLKRQAINKSDISAIAFAQGPGAFTGLRVACGVTQGLAFALNRPVIAVTTHRAIASQVSLKSGDLVVVATDANMNELYVSAYLVDLDVDWTTLLEPTLISPNDTHRLYALITESIKAQPFVGQRYLVGNALRIYEKYFTDWDEFVQDPTLESNAYAVAEVAHGFFIRGQVLSASEAVPLYVRDKIAFTTSERLTGLANSGNPAAQTLNML